MIAQPHPRSIAAAALDRGSAFPPWVRAWLLLGLGWLIIGMAVLPAGPSYNPGKLYTYSVGLGLYLPALVLLARPREALALWRQPLMPWVIALLAWGCVSQLWSHAQRPEDQIARNLSIVVFLYAWMRAIDGDARRVRLLLMGCAVVLAAVAVAAFVHYELQPEDGRRLAGFGVMANANLAAAAMGVAALWLSAWSLRNPRYRLVQALAWIVLVVFVLLTFTRSAWAALFAGLLVFVLLGRSRPWLYGSILAGLGAVCFIAYLPEITERGWSLRPEIMKQSWLLFRESPWLGLGQGSEFTIRAGNEVLTHAHNLFSQLAIQLGLPGLVLWSGIWLGLAWRGWRHRHKPLGRLVLATWVFAMVMVQVDLPHLLDSPRPGWLVLWLPIALSFALGRDEPVARSKAVRR
ncbi:O-antigen ligase family protein [Lysobacter cavernae]|uniref:O-antigen ligase family protein n=1 Tax=Lysobacter cavernae TaxID=1685901 RepID=A0ABV7RMM2_9GAMM